ncbi:OmpH family outer membrane protein [Salegentibacter sp.]|uniref:OmpH family outer membrane protein n=1 Tax=Salegentibacter sp. TaxID=1903072 RepID=UPI003565F063
MKKTTLLFAFILLGYISNAQTKTGTIDADYIIGQMPAMEEVNLGLQNYDSEMQQDLQETIKEYEGLIEVYQKDRETLNEEERAEKENEIIGLENDIKGFRQRASVMMQMRRNELTKPLYDEINQAMQQVIQEEGYTQILHANGNSLAFADERYDITEKVLGKLGIDPEEVQEEE